MPISSFIEYTHLQRYLENLTIDYKFTNKRFRFLMHQVMCLAHVEEKKLLARHKLRTTVN